MPSGTQVDHKKWTSFCTDTSLDKLSCSVSLLLLLFLLFLCFVFRRIYFWKNPVFRKNTEGLPGEGSSRNQVQEKLENTVACSCSAVTPWKRCMNHSLKVTESLCCHFRCGKRNKEWNMCVCVCVSWDELPYCLRCVPPWTAGGKPAPPMIKGLLSGNGWKELIFSFLFQTILALEGMWKWRDGLVWIQGRLQIEMEKNTHPWIY